MSERAAPEILLERVIRAEERAGAARAETKDAREAYNALRALGVSREEADEATGLSKHSAELQRLNRRYFDAVFAYELADGWTSRFQ